MKKHMSIGFIWLLIMAFTALPGAARAAADSEDGINTIRRSYDWYLNQYDTGEDARINCGPACAVMAAKWYDADFQGTVRQARESIPDLAGKWWYYRDIRSYLSQDGIDMTYALSFTINDAIKTLDEGKMMIVNIHSRDISYRNDETAIGRFYTGEFGHFIILKGYRQADGVSYFEVYDPYTMNSYDADGLPMGKDRLYPADEVETSVCGWGDAEYIIINPPKQLK